MVLCRFFFFFFSFKDWICNKIEHCDVGMIFHSYFGAQIPSRRKNKEENVN